MTETPIEFTSDISLDLATRAHRNTSFSPEERGLVAINDYVQTLTSDLTEFTALAEKHSATEALDEIFPRYRKALQSATLAHLSARTRCISSMITGGANFPVARAEKANATEHRRLQDLIDCREKWRKRILKAITPAGDGPIMSGDADAVERLAAKLEEAEAKHAEMKAANKVRAGSFQPFELSGSSARIRAIKLRIASVEKATAAPVVEVQGPDALIVDCPPDNRIRLFFAAKPDAEKRTELKRAGYRWTPSLGCWQAYRNWNSTGSARGLAGFVKAA